MANSTDGTISPVETAYCDEACDERDEHPECDEDGGEDTGDTGDAEVEDTGM